MRLLLFALALQPAIVAFPVGRHLRGLNLEPALMIVEIFLGRDENLARPDHRLLDDGDRLLESGDGFGVGVLSRGGHARFSRIGLTMRSGSPKPQVHDEPHETQDL